MLRYYCGKYQSIWHHTEGRGNMTCLLLHFACCIAIHLCSNISLRIRFHKFIGNPVEHKSSLFVDSKMISTHYFCTIEPDSELKHWINEETSVFGWDNMEVHSSSILECPVLEVCYKIHNSSRRLRVTTIHLFKYQSRKFHRMHGPQKFSITMKLNFHLLVEAACDLLLYRKDFENVYL